MATDRIGALSSAAAGDLMAKGWVATGKARAEVVPIGEAGAGFAQAVADSTGAETTGAVSDGGLVTVVDTPERLVVGVEATTSETQLGIDREASSYPIGAALDAALQASRHHAPEIVLDVAANRAHDAGAGLLAALGATGNVALDRGVAGLAGVSRVEMDPVHRRLDGRRLTVVVPSGQEKLPLLGLRGITSRFGRDQGWHPELLLAADASLQAFTVAAAPGLGESADWGACGGLGFVAHALGGRVMTGSGYCAEVAGLSEVLRRADLLVTGCSTFDFAERGGGVVAQVAQLGEQATVPVVLIAGTVVIGAREMRTMGIESAYGVRETHADEPDGEVTAEELAATAERVARSWSW